MPRAENNIVSKQDLFFCYDVVKHDFDHTHRIHVQLDRPRSPQLTTLVGVT